MTESDETQSLDDLSNKAVEIAKRRQAAAVAVIKLFDQEIATLQGHLGTILYAASWLAGTSLYRSLGLEEDIAPGVIVLSAKADQQINALMKVFMFLLQKDGVKLQADEFVPKIPEPLQPRKTLLQIQEQFQDRYNEIMKAHGFDCMEGAKTGAVVCALLVKVYTLRRKDMETNMAASIVSLGFIEGAKTAPAPLKR